METNRLVHVLFDLTENLEGFIPKIDQKQPSNVVNLAYAFEGLNPILEELEAQGQAVLAQRLEKHYQQHLAQAQVLDQHIQETPNDGDLLRCDAAALELGVRHVVSWLANSCMKLGAAKEQQPATFNNQASVQDFTNLIREIVQASGVGQAPMSSYLRGQIKKAHNLGCSLNPCLLISEKHDPKKSHSECSIREIDPPTDEAGKRSHYLRWATDILCHHFQGRAIQDDEKDSLSKIADALDGGKTLVDEAAPLGQRTPAGQPPSASKPRRRSLKHPATSTQESESTTTNGNNRRSLSPKDEAKILEKCRRRCCICFVLDHDTSEKKGQLAHFDHDRSNNAVSNFVYLCLPHHDTYDSKTSQAKNLTEHEVRLYQQTLHEAMVRGEGANIVNTGLERLESRLAATPVIVDYRTTRPATTELQRSRRPDGGGSRKLVRSIVRRSAFWLVVFGGLEFVVGLCAWRWGEGENLWQKIINSWQVFGAVGVVSVIAYPFLLGRERRQLLKFWKGDDK